MLQNQEIKLLNLIKKYIGKQMLKWSYSYAPKMAELVKEYTSEKINDDIPIIGGLSSDEISYWKKYILI